MADADGSSILERCAHLVYNQEPETVTATTRLEERLAEASMDVEAIQAVLAEIAVQNGYVRFHALRFMDQLRALASLAEASAGRGRIRVLDVGVSPASTLYADHLQVIVHSAGLPSPTPAIATAAMHGTEAHYYVDFETEALTQRYPDLAGRFDAVMFCEVIEHVRANPVEQIADLLALLRPGGHMVLTTPNAINRHWLARVLTGRLMTTTYDRERIRTGQVAEYHVREYTLAELCDAAVQAGGEVIDRGLRDWYGASPIDGLVPHVSSRHGIMLMIRRPF